MAERAKSLKAPRLGAQGQGDLPGGLFAERFHGALVYEAARAEQLARRGGNASTLTRAQVRGGGTKPWRQKGTGRARAGSIRAPHWTGGGTTFGPTPRRYTVKVNRKAHRRALRAALSLHADRGSVALIDAAGFDSPSTRKAAEVLAKWGAESPVLVVLGQEEALCAKSFRNLDRVNVLPASGVGVADLLRAASLVVSEAALDELGRAGGADERPTRSEDDGAKSGAAAEA